MADIDYSKYLAGLGDVPTNQELVIKKYLEEQCEKDEAFKAVYKADKLHDCYNFIKKAVENLPHTGNFICVDDAVVFKMARDYFIDILPAIDVTPVQETVKEVANSIEADARTDDVKRTELGFEVFGEEADEPEEEAEQEPCNQDEVGEQEAADKPMRYDEDGQALLFDFM